MINKINITILKLSRTHQAVLWVSFFLLLVSAVPSYADIYKYEDEEGVIHLTNVPSNPKAK
ncbi:MAG: DUF4124 domain-containing protein, partial [Deltaproteobacteria bacterium]|nr:DUF4124 domain-containing protein [Deltaproteobacteria bacterium]